MNENTALGKLIEVPLLVSIKIQTESFAQVLPRFKTVIKNQMNLEKVNILLLLLLLLTFLASVVQYRLLAF